jgi:endonuclease YncB( thermonuclease family)
MRYSSRGPYFARPFKLWFFGGVVLMTAGMIGGVANHLLKPSVKILDGDTLELATVRHRLHGIDAPEMKQPGGVEAREFLVKFVGRNSVTCKPVSQDLHGRQVSRCYVRSMDLSRLMVSSGYAIAYRRYSTEYVPEEVEAISHKRGLWATIGIEVPEQFRRRSSY